MSVVKRDSGNESLGPGSFASQQTFQVKTEMWCWKTFGYILNISVKKGLFCFFGEALSQGWLFYVLIQKDLILPWGSLAFRVSFSFHHHPLEPFATQGILEVCAGPEAPAATGQPLPLCTSGAPVWFVCGGQVRVMSQEKLITLLIFNKLSLPPSVSPFTLPWKNRLFRHIWTLFVNLLPWIPRRNVLAPIFLSKNWNGSFVYKFCACIF